MDRSAAIFKLSRSLRIKPRLNEKALSSIIVFATHNMGWLKEQTMFDQTSNKVSTHNWTKMSDCSAGT